MRGYPTIRKCIDLNGQTAPEEGITCSRVKALTHHVIVRADLPIGVKVANVLHAAGESAVPRPKPGCTAVALHARDENHLREVLDRLRKANIRCHPVYECDDDVQYPGQLMAVGVCPTDDRAALRKVLSSLPLVR